MKSLLKRILPESARRRARHLGRLRFLTKARVARRYGLPPGRALRYVLADPEVDSFSYRIANVDELAATLAGVLDRPEDEIRGYLVEAREDPVLSDALKQPWRHWLWAKRHPHPKGYHEACWAVLRATRPAVAVETGILDGLGSTVMLAALERNAREGAEGELISFDVMPGAGQMVPASLRRRWTTVWADAGAAIDEVIGERRIGFISSDSLRDPAQIRREVEAAHRHRAAPLVAMTTWGRLGHDWPAERIVRFRERPADHFYGGVTFAIARM